MSDAITIHVNGQPLAARKGQSVAAALLMAGWRSFGPNPKTGAPLALKKAGWNHFA